MRAGLRLEDPYYLGAIDPKVRDLASREPTTHLLQLIADLGTVLWQFDNRLLDLRFERERGSVRH